jgi:hypothetical protein
MADLKPFADDSAALAIGDFKIENGQDKIALYGNLDITRDRVGLKNAQALKALLDEVVRTLSAQKDLPATIPPLAPPASVKNPFG